VRTNLFVLALLVAAALVVSVLMIPGTYELAWLRFREGEIDAARDGLERAVAQGRSSPGMLGTLAEIYLAEGEPERAIELVERVVAADPANLAARERLGRLYLDARRVADHLRNLEELHRLDPGSARTRELADLYRSLGRGAERRAMLARLAGLGAATPAERVELAERLARERRRDEAREALRPLLAAPSPPPPRDAILLAAALAADAGDAAGLGGPLADRLREAADPGLTTLVAATLADRGRPDLALVLAGPLAGEDPGLGRALARIEAAAGRPEDAIRRLADLRARAPGDAGLAADLVDLSLSAGRGAQAFATLLAADPGALRPALLARAVEAARLAGRRDVVDAVARAVPPARLAYEPLLAAWIAFARGGAPAAGALLDRLAAPGAVAAPDLPDLARLLVAAGRPADALAALRRIPAEGDPAFLGRLYLAAGAPAEGLARLDGVPAAPGSELAAVRAILAAAAGRDAPALDWLAGSPGDAEAVAELAEAALAGGAARAAVAATAILLERAPGDAARTRHARALVAAGRAADALSLLSAAGRGAPEVEAARVLAWRALGEAGRALDHLLSLAGEGALADPLLPDLAGLALERDRPGDALAALSGRGAAALASGALSAEAAAALVARAVALGDAPRALDFARSFPPDLLAARPRLAARLALARGDGAEARRWIEAADRGYLDPMARLDLARLRRDAGQGAAALADLASVARAGALPPGAPTELAALYLGLARAGEGAKALARLRADAPSAEADAAWARLAVAAGAAREVEDWLRSAPAAAGDAALLRDVYHGAADRKSWPLALAAASALDAREPGPASRALLAAARLATGRPDLAADLLERDAAAGLSPEADAVYVEALAAAKDVRRLVPHLLARLADPGLDRGRATALLYPLDEALERAGAAPATPSAAPVAARLARELDGGPGDRTAAEARRIRLAVLLRLAPDAALPRLAEAAARAPREHGDQYLAALDRLGRRDEARAFAARLALDPGTPAAEARGLGFRLLELGDKPAAERVFLRLSEGAAPGSPDVSQLLFLWGPRPTPDQVALIERRARAARGAERTAWLRLMVEGGAPARALAVLAEAPPAPGRDPDLVALWLDALALGGDAAGIEAVVRRETPAATSVQALRRLAAAAEAAGRPAAAAPAWDAVLARDPDDRAALAGSARAANLDRRRAKARLLYERLEALGGADAESLFQHAELLLAAREGDAARPRFQAALDRLAKPSDDRERALRALALHRLGRSEEAVAELRPVVRRLPRDASLRADLANVLLDIGRTAEARELLDLP
jgi:predicted Zn-dependent protease